MQVPVYPPKGVHLFMEIQQFSQSGCICAQIFCMLSYFLCVNSGYFEPINFDWLTFRGYSFLGIEIWLLRFWNLSWGGQFIDIAWRLKTRTFYGTPTGQTTNSEQFVLKEIYHYLKRQDLTNYTNALMRYEQMYCASAWHYYCLFTNLIKIFTVLQSCAKKALGSWGETVTDHLFTKHCAWKCGLFNLKPIFNEKDDSTICDWGDSHILLSAFLEDLHKQEKLHQSLQCWNNNELHLL